MRVGTPREIKNHEYRVGLTPAGARELSAHGHQVYIESGAGLGIGIDDEVYRRAGATIVATAAELFDAAELIIKVKEPQPAECRLLRERHVVFTYLHLAPDAAQTRALVDSGCVAIAYETVTDARGGLPLLAPMSEVAGRMSIQAGAHAMEKAQGGNGVLLGGVPGVPAAEVVVLGGGVVGYNAARIAVGMGARVTVIDRSLSRLNWLDTSFDGRLTTLYSTVDAVEASIARADLLIGAVLVPGAAAPKLVTRSMLKLMAPGTVIVDVAIDQGGCFETSKSTTHQQPTYTVDGIVHYCVANMPGGVAHTSTFALTNATLPFALALADKGYCAALRDDPHLQAGLNVHRGRVTYRAVADVLGYDYLPPQDALRQSQASVADG